MIHAISTGKVKITKNWIEGKGSGIKRLANTMFDKAFTDWLPIWCYLIEDQGHLILVDTGISQATRKRRYFPPHNLLVQRAVDFSLAPEEEIGPQIRALGYDPKDVDKVVLTHLHQDHDGGLHYFANAEFIVSQEEWKAANGFAGRMAGYINQLWPKSFSPRLIEFNNSPFAAFPKSYQIGERLTLVPTPGHSPGHMTLVYDHLDVRYFIIGDTAYSEHALFNEITDGVTADIETAKMSMRRLCSSFAHDKNNIVLPSHDAGVLERLEKSA
jgi:glyoxylase-like metal-dependent hydrolase (beta-lactamase superfamily II)